MVYLLGISNEYSREEMPALRGNTNVIWNRVVNTKYSLSKVEKCLRDIQVSLRRKDDG